jgi:hypothetical protein
MNDVLFLDDLAQLLRTSRRTIEKMRRAGVFPIPEIRGIDKRPRWSRVVVQRFLEQGDVAATHRRGWRRSA